MIENSDNSNDDDFLTVLQKAVQKNKDKRKKIRANLAENAELPIIFTELEKHLGPLVKGSEERGLLHHMLTDTWTAVEMEALREAIEKAGNDNFAPPGELAKLETMNAVAQIGIDQYVVKHGFKGKRDVSEALSDYTKSLLKNGTPPENLPRIFQELATAPNMLYATFPDSTS